MDRRRYPGADGGVQGTPAQGGLGRWHGPLGPLFRAIAAWPLLLVTGSSLFLTGQLDWGPGVYGERAVFAMALGVSSFGLWALGERTDRERAACWATLIASVLALALFYGTTRLQFNSAIWLVHLGLCWQLAAWALAARKAQALGLWIMAAGQAVETFIVIPVVQLTNQDAICATGSKLACLDGPFVAVGLPALVTVMLIVIWLTPLEARIRGLLGRS